MSAFRRLSVKKLVKQHCPDDIGCLHCCKCWQQHRKQYQIRIVAFNAKYQQAKKQIEFLKNLNKDLKMKLDQYSKRQRLFQDVEVMKTDLRQQIQKQILAKRQAQDYMIKQKIKSMEQDIQQYKNNIQNITNKLHDEQIKNNNLQISLNQAQMKIHKLQQQKSKIDEDNNYFINQVQKLQEQVQKYQTIIKQKNDVIQRIQASINEIQNKYILQRTKAYNNNSQKQMLQINVKNKDKYIDSLTKCTQQNLKSMQSLQLNNKQLKHLTSKLDCQIAAGRIHQQYLRGRLLQSEERLAVTQGFAYYNSQKVELMKNDLQLLKLTL